MKKIQIIAFSFVLMCGALAHADATDSGVAAYDLGDYPTALELLQPLAEDGDAIAQSYLASMYDWGLGVKYNSVIAASWYLKSADQGDKFSQYHIGTKYRRGVGVPEDIDKAISYLLLAAGQGSTDAQYDLVRIESSNKTFNLERAKSIEWLTNAANAGHVFAQYDLANIFSEKGDFESSRLAVHWWNESARQKNSDAQYALGRAYSEGFGVLTDLQRAYMWFSIAADHGAFGAKLDKGFLGVELSPEQILRANEMANFCVKTNYEEC